MAEDLSDPTPTPFMLAGFAPGQVVAGYRLEEQIGVGGMAVVFRAMDDRLGRRVALKILAPALASDVAFRKRFVRESRAAAAVDDPHIVPVYAAGEADGLLYIAMRLVPGRDVRTLLALEGPLPLIRVAAVISPVASALDAAHAAGLVHRDVKPGNMLLDIRPDRPDHVYLSDFGLSKSAMSSAGLTGLTGLGQFLGTPSYISPEQIRGGDVDGRADQYALACAAYELLIGAPPYQRDQPTAVIWAHMSEPPPLLSTRRAELRPAVDEVFAKAMAKRPADRFDQCKDFAEALRAALGLASYSSGVQVVPVVDLVPGPALAPGPVAEVGLGFAQTVTSARAGLPAADLPPAAVQPAAVQPVLQPDVEAADAGVEVSAVAIGPDGRTVAVGDMAGRAFLSAVPSGRVLEDLTRQLGGGVSAVAYRPDGSLIAFAGSDGGTRLWDPSARRLAAVLRSPGAGAVAALAFSPDGGQLAAGNDNGAVYLWDVAGERVVATLTGPATQGVLDAEFSPDGTRLAVADAAGYCYLWDLRQQRLAAPLDHIDHGEVFSVAWTADGTVLATGDAAGRICLWDPYGTALMSVLTRRRRPSAVFDLAFSSRDLRLAAGYLAGGVSVWSAGSGRLVTTLGHRDPGAVLAVSWSPDGSALATGSSDGGAWLWDVGTKSRTALGG